jgi:Reverse transcriptase (RNA-dependent DNA polymerase)
MVDVTPSGTSDGNNPAVAPNGATTLAQTNPSGSISEMQGGETLQSDGPKTRCGFDEAQEKTIIRFIRELNVWDGVKQKIKRNGWTSVHTRWVEDMVSKNQRDSKRYNHTQNSLMQRFAKLIKEGKVSRGGEYPTWIASPTRAIAPPIAVAAIPNMDERSPQGLVIHPVDVPAEPRLESEMDWQVEEDAGRGGTARIEYDPVPEDFESKFCQLLASTITGKTRRRAIKRWRCNDGKVLRWADSLVQKYLRPRNKPLEDPTISRLNALAYAAGQTCHLWISQWAKPHREREVTWFDENRKEQEGLSKWIQWIHDELEARRNPSSGSTSTRRYRLRQLKQRFKLSGTTNSLLERLESQKMQLDLKRKAAKIKRDEIERGRVRRKPLGLILRGDSKPCEIDSVEKVREYWSTIIGQTVPFEETDALQEWMMDIDENVVPQIVDNYNMRAMFRKVMSKAKPWRAPGPDGIPNKIWKSIPTLRDQLFKWIEKTRDHRAHIPKWLPTGRIVLLPKEGDPRDPSNYRPIACLNTCYKLITATITEMIKKHVQDQNILPSEQLALREGKQGCIDAAILDQTIMTDALFQKKRDLSVAWVDMAKAFDSVSIPFIHRILRLMKIAEPIRDLINDLMRLEIRYEIKKAGGITQQSKPLKVKNGVPQGDSLSPMLFCLAMAPISHALNAQIPRYVTSTGGNKGAYRGNSLTLNHLFYMDDLKIFTTSPEMVEKALSLVKREAGAIGLRLNPKKCALAHLCKGSDGTTASTPFEGIPVLGKCQTYKYLGIKQDTKTSIAESWDSIEKAILDREARIWDKNVNMSMRQKISAHNTAVTPVAFYIARCIVIAPGQLRTLLLKAKKLDTKIAKVMKAGMAIHATSSRHRMYIVSDHMGYGLKSIKDTVENGLVYTWLYIYLSPDFNTSMYLFASMIKKNERCIQADAETILGNRELTDRIEWMTEPRAVSIDGEVFRDSTIAARQMCRRLNEARQADYLAEWQATQMSSGVIGEGSCADEYLSGMWIRKGHLSTLSFRNAIAIQEGIAVRNAEGGIVLCRQCHKGTETAAHVAAGCTQFSKTIMLERHNDVARAFYNELSKKYGIPVRHFTQDPFAVVENDRVKIYWDQYVVTRRKLTCYRPDIVVFDKMDLKIYVIEVGVSWYSRLDTTRDIKYGKYAINSTIPHEDLDMLPYPSGPSLRGELENLHTGYSVLVVPIVIGCSGEISAKTYDDLRQLNLHPKRLEYAVEKAQRAAVLGTSRIVRAHYSKNLE